MTNTLQFFFNLYQINPLSNKSHNKCHGCTIHFSLFETYGQGLFIRRQGLGLLLVGVLKFKLGVICVEGVIQIVHSFTGHECRI